MRSLGRITLRVHQMHNGKIHRTTDFTNRVLYERRAGSFAVNWNGTKTTCIPDPDDSTVYVIETQMPKRLNVIDAFAAFYQKG